MWPDLIPDVDFWIPKTFGVVIMIGACLSIWLAAKRGEQFGFEKEKIWDFGIYMVLAGILGARFIDVWNHWGEKYWGPYQNGDFGLGDLLLKCIAIWEGGLTFYGGLIVSAILGIWLVRKWDYDFWKFTDVIMPSLALGHAFGQIGNFMQGIGYGKVCEVGFQGVQYPEPFYQNQAVIDRLGIEATSAQAALHPTQLYEAGAGLFIFFFLSWLLFRKRAAGSLLFVWMMLYGAARFTVEFWRADNMNHDWLGMTLHFSQYVSMFMVFVGVVGYWCLKVANSNDGLQLDTAATASATSQVVDDKPEEKNEDDNKTDGS